MDSSKIKRGLGRGLSSLIGETKVESNKNQLQISDLTPNKFQPRKIFDEENLNDLTNSIKERGILQPIIVRKSEDEKSKFEIKIFLIFIISIFFKSLIDPVKNGSQARKIWFLNFKDWKMRFSPVPNPISKFFFFFKKKLLFKKSFISFSTKK